MSLNCYSSKLIKMYLNSDESVKETGKVDLDVTKSRISQKL